MTRESTWLDPKSFRGLHRGEIVRVSHVRELLSHALASGVVCTAGIDRRSRRQEVRLQEIGIDRVLARCIGIRAEVGRQLSISLNVEGEAYFFVSEILATSGATIAIRLPSAIYIAEQRESPRLNPNDVRGAPTKILLGSEKKDGLEATVVDWTPGGMCIELDGKLARRLDDNVSIVPIDGRDAGQGLSGWRRHRVPLDKSRERVGFAVSKVPWESPPPIEYYSEAPRSLLPCAPTQTVPKASVAESERVEFGTEGEGRLVGILDKTGCTRGAVGVVIPPAWGRTKETLLPLALSIVETFRRVGQPVAVLRFDGSMRRGESAGLTQVGAEQIGFTFSGAASDLRAAVAFLRDGLGTAKVVITSFSLSAIESRRVLADDGGADIAGWVSVVGAPDLQATLHTISGGIDYAAGLLRGISFGLQELFGVVVDIDRAGHDGIEHGLVFKEDARRDMARISQPITWLHGQHDSWVDRDRIRELVGCGRRDGRRLIELPVAHQLRTSSEALQVFRLVSSEAARLGAGRLVAGAAPDPARYRLRRSDEKRHRIASRRSLRHFWRDYLSDAAGGGMQLLNASTPYRRFVDEQIAEAFVRPGSRILDLGSGLGAVTAALLQSSTRLVVDRMDLDHGALSRATRRLSDLGGARGFAATVNLDSSRGGIPVRDETYDATLASLVLNYVKDPNIVVREMLRVLRPGGRLVVSALRRDADVSPLYSEALPESYSREAQNLLNAPDADAIQRAVPVYLNHASRILDYEERGVFQFYDQDELHQLLSDAGVAHVTARKGLGDPPQAVIASGTKR